MTRAAAHEAITALMRAPRDSDEGRAAVRVVTARLAAEEGESAVRDLAEALIVDLAKALTTLAAIKGREPSTAWDALLEVKTRRDSGQV